MEISRRELLAQCSKLLILTATAAKAIEKTGTPPGPDDTYHMAEHWWGMIIDTEKCIGCGNCVRGCSKENQVPEGYFRTWVERYQVTEDRERPLVDSPNGAINGFPPASREDVKSFYVPKLCNHCVDSPCVQVCPVERTTLDELFDLVVADYRETGKRSIVDVLSRLKLHLRPRLGKLRAADFGSADVRRYKAARKTEKAEPATINRELSVLKRAFSLGSRHDPPLVLHDPPIEKIPENNVRTGFLEKPDYDRLLAELPPYLKLPLVIAYHTGCRLGEVMSLQWPDINLNGREILIRAEHAKSKNHRVLPIYGDMIDTLKRQRAEHEAKYPRLDWVVHDGNGNRLRTFYKAWKSACDRAKLDGRLFHDLRRSAVRNMVRAGIPEKVAMAISGHRTRHVFDRYNIVTDKDLAAAAQQMTRYLAGEGASKQTHSGS